MTDYSELKRLAESANAVKSDVNITMAVGTTQEEVKAVQDFLQLAMPKTILALIAEIEFLTESRQEAREDRNKIGDRHDAIEAERDQLKAEIGALRKDDLRAGLMALAAYIGPICTAAVVAAMGKGASNG